MSTIQYMLKKIPSDFIVEEIAPDKTILSRTKKYTFKKNTSGKFLHFILEKENRDTFEVLNEIARKLHVSSDVFSIAGMKDKKAITVQMASAYKIKKEQIDAITVHNVKLIPLRYSAKKVFLGNLEGNRFTITVRNISKDPKDLRKSIEMKIRKMNGIFPNYFGEQRFGEDKSTQKIGKLIILRNFKSAAKECAAKYEICRYYLKKYPKNYIGAIKQLPLKLQKMFIHAVQAEIFNSALYELLKKKPLKKEIEIPLPGYTFSSRIFTSEIDKIVEYIMKKENITANMFILDEIPKLSSDGELRRAFEEFRDFKILEICADEIHAQKTKAVLQFALNKGCYATVFLKEVFGKTLA